MAKRGKGRSIGRFRASLHSYEVPTGVGCYIPSAIESVGAALYVWRQLNAPAYWHSEDARYRGQQAYVCSVRNLTWDDEAERMAALCLSGEVWLLGWHSEQTADPVDAAHFSQLWHMQTHGVICGPGVALDGEGLRWLDAYMDNDGYVPEAWHVHLSARLDAWPLRYQSFVDWMARRRVYRPVVVTDVDAGPLCTSFDSAALMTWLVERGFALTSWLSAVMWSQVMGLPDRESNLVGVGLRASVMGRQWTRLVKESRDAIASRSAGSGGGVVVAGDRARHK